MDYVLYLLIRIITAFSRLSRFLAKAGIGTYDQWTPGKKIKILLVGYNGARNTGSDVRVVETARQIKALFGKDQVQITVMTMDTASLEGYFDEDVSLLRFSSLFPFDLYRACSGHHAAILCEGSTLKSTFANALTLFLCEAAGIMRSQGKPCIAYGAEIGEMESFLTKAAKTLCRDVWFITRSEESYAALKRLGLKGSRGTDTAWFYDQAICPEEAENMLRSQGWDGKKPLLGICAINPFCWPVRASLKKWIRSILGKDHSGQYDHWYFFSDSPARRKNYASYIREVSQGINAFLQEQDYFPVLLGMERLDEKACRDVLRQLNTPAALFLSAQQNAAVITGILRRLSLLVTSRYHAAVLSMEHACPIAAVSMDERLDGIMHDMKLDPYLLHVTDEHLGRGITDTLSSLVGREEQIHLQIRRRLDEHKSALSRMGIFLKRYLEKALQDGRN